MYCQQLSELNLNDTPNVGGKCSSLGEMYNQLTAKGIRVPNAFVITVATYQEFLKFNNLDHVIRDKLDHIDYQDLVSIKRGGLQIRNLILNAQFPPLLREYVIDCYYELSQQYKDSNGNPQSATDVAVRSSSISEDGADCSFAGQYDTFLNVRGEFQLIEAIKGCYASLYNNRAISYRHDMKKDDPADLAIAVVIQKMVRADCGKSGVMFTVDTESGFDQVIVINASYGLCELIVNKKKLKEGYPAIIDKKMGRKTSKMIYSDNPAEKVRIVPVAQELQKEFSLSSENILELAEWAVKVEEHYNQFYGANQCYDIEFAFDGLERKMYLVQVRPETIHSGESKAESNCLIQYSLTPKHDQNTKRILSGTSIGNSIVTGTVRMVMNLDERGDNQEIIFNPGDILVTSSTDPDWEPLMKKAGGIITDCGGRTSHASIVSRELGVTCVVGTGDATSVLKNGQVVTIDCSHGDTGYVYSGQVDFSQVKVDLNSLPKSPIPLMMNLASPEIAFRYARLPHCGVGLAREEFIINNFIQVHPLALLDYDTGRFWDQPELKNQIENLIRGYDSGRDYFINKLTYGISRIATAVDPHPVIVRFSDFKSNEYANLLGGDLYEPKEENPMLGWRGCSRYYSKEYREAFGLECAAIKKVREELGLSNVIVMLPFCRTPEEFNRVAQVMADFGLVRGQNGLQVYLMCELPSNVILAQEFCQLVDGFSIGSNDLTQLTLGIDRDSDRLAHLFNENHQAVREMISQAIRVCRSNDVKIGICGQGPSDNLDFAEFLVKQGIDTISLTPDSLVGAIQRLSKI